VRGEEGRKESIGFMHETSAKRSSTAKPSSSITEQLRLAREVNRRLLLRSKDLNAENAKVSEEIVLLGEEVNNLRVRAGLPKREIVVDFEDQTPLAVPDIKERRFPIPASARRFGQQDWVLAQLTPQHFDVVLEIQDNCYEPVHCEEKQAYVDRLHFYPEGSVVLILPNENIKAKLLSIPPPPGRARDPTYKAETIAGYVLFQPFFKGEVHMDADTRGLTDRDRMVKEGLRAYDCMYIHEMSVHPAFRGKRCTGPLLAYVEDCARAAGFKVVTLVSLPAANDYWLYNGFVEKYRLDYAGTPSVYMEKVLEDT